MSITLLIVIAIFFILGLSGFVTGFLRKIFTTVTLIACVFIAGALTAPISALVLQNTEMNKFVAKIIVYLSICLAVYIAMRIIFSVLKIAEKFKPVAAVNHIAGMLVGIAEGLFLVWLFMLFVTMLQAFPIGQGALADIDGNPFLKFLYDNNVLLNFVRV